MQRLRLRQSIKRDWNAFVSDVDDQHRRYLWVAIDRANVSEIASNVALAAASASMLPDSASTARQKTVAHELVLREKIQSLRDLTDLVAVETRIGARVAVFRAFDAGARTDHLRRQSNLAARLVA